MISGKVVAEAPDGVPAAMLPVFTALMISISLVISVPGWNWTSIAPLDFSLISLAIQVKATEDAS